MTQRSFGLAVTPPKWTRLVASSMKKRTWECLDRILIVGRRQLEQVVRTYISHHNEHRPHRSLEQRPPLAKPPPAEQPPPNQVGRRDRLGGVIHEYYGIAA